MNRVWTLSLADLTHLLRISVDGGRKASKKARGCNPTDPGPDSRHGLDLEPLRKDHYPLHGRLHRSSSQPARQHSQILTLRNCGTLPTRKSWYQDAAAKIISGTSREFLNAYQEYFGVLLPTAGTMLDMGRTITQKKIVVEMSLEGLSTQQIARKIFLTPEAVNQYLRLFDRSSSWCFTITTYRLTLFARLLDTA